MKTWKENKNDEGFKEKTEVVGLGSGFLYKKGKKAGCWRIIKECKGSHFFKSLSQRMY